MEWRGLVFRGLVVVLLVAALGALPSSASSFDYCARATALFSDSRPYVGNGDPAVAAQSVAQRNCSLGLMASHHIGYYRLQLNWGLIERVPGVYDFRAYDQVLADVASHHMRMLFVLIGEPAWQSSAPPGAPRGAPYPPRDPSAFAQFAAIAVRRYGPGGTFWSSHPNLPYEPVRAWELWNEPDLSQSWAQPNMRSYVQLLRPTYSAIKSVDAHATVIIGGMAFYCENFQPVACASRHSDETRWISSLFRWGARGYFDALGIHPYSANLAQAEDRLWAARQLLDRSGNRRKGLWITEYGFAGGGKNNFLTNARRQRLDVSKFFTFVQANRARLRLQEVIWFAWQDQIYAPGPTNWWGFHLGLISTGGQAKPALAAFSAAAQRLDR